MSELVGILPPSVEQDPVRRALDCLQEGFQVIGFDWTYVYLNPAAARHGRRAVHELLGRRITEEYPGIEQTPMFAVLRRSMDRRTSEIYESEFTFPEGGKRWFEIRVHPCPEGICVYSSDIDHRKRRQTELERAHAGGGQSYLRRLWQSVTGR